MEKILNTYRYKMIVKRDRLFLVFPFFAFFIGQAVLFSFANPFFAPFLTLFLGENNIIFMLVLVPLILGATFSFNGTFLSTYIFIGLFLLTTNIYLRYERIIIDNKRRMIICGVATIIGGIIPVIVYQMSIYFLVYFLVFALISGVITKLLSDGFSILTLQKNINVAKSSDIIGFSILISSILYGILSLQFELFNVFLFFSLLLIFIISNSIMKNSTLTFAFVITIVPFLTNRLNIYEFIIILSLAFSTLLSFENDKKSKVICIFPALVLSYFYIDVSFFSRGNILAILTSSLVFLAIPNNFYEKVQANYGFIDNTFYPYAQKIKDYSSISLRKYSIAFSNLSKIFEDIITTRDLLTLDDYKNISDNVVDKVCRNCRSYNTCFTKTGFTTQNTIRYIIKAIELNDNELLDKHIHNFSKLCMKKEEFITVLNIYFEFLKTQIEWKNKIIENKLLVSEQLYEVSNVFNNIKNDISSNIVFFPDMEKNIVNKLYLHSIYPINVLVVKTSDGIVNIFVTVDIDITQKEAFRVITSICSEVSDKKLKITKTVLLDNGNYEITLEELAKFNISFGVSFKKKDEFDISGDSYSVSNINSRQALLAISDGMGSGEEASKSSTLALNLLEEFLESGFDKDTAIKLINSSLLLKNTNDSFATIDSIIVDLYKGDAQFIKIGAVQSFILREGAAFSINSKSLPIGILNNIETQIYKKRLNNNDYLILLSDGVLDVVKSYKEQEYWIENILKNFRGASSKDLSEYIIEEALKVSENSVKDDMTVVVGKITKNKIYT